MSDTVRKQPAKQVFHVVFGGALDSVATRFSPPPLPRLRRREKREKLPDPQSQARQR